MDFFNKVKLKVSEKFNKEKGLFDSYCNIKVKLINQKRALEKAIRNESGNEYSFYERVPLRIGDIFVDDNNRLLEIIDVSNILVDEQNGFKYKVATVKKYTNPAGIVNLIGEQKVNDSNKVIMESARDIIINNSSITNSNTVILSLLQNIDLTSAWEASKSDLYNLFDYENYRGLENNVDNYFKGERVKESTFKKCLEIAKGIAGVLGVFVGSILSEILKNNCN